MDVKLFHKERAVGTVTGAVSDIPVSWSCGRGWLTSLRVARGVSTSPSAKCHMSQTSEIGGAALYLQGDRYGDLWGLVWTHEDDKAPAPPLEITAAFINNRLVWKRAFPFLDFWVRATCSFTEKGAKHTGSGFISLCDLPDKLRGCCN